jgi:hypothetical protein
MSEFNSLRAFMDADSRSLRDQAKKQASDRFSKGMVPARQDFPPNVRTEQLSPVTPPHLELYYPPNGYQTAGNAQERDGYTTGDYQLRDYQLGNTPAAWQGSQGTNSIQTGNYQHLPAPLPGTSAVSTQSLVLALQATMTQKNGRTPVVIPGSRNRTRNLQALPDTDSFQFNTAGTPRKMRHHWRHIIAISSTLIVILFTLLSLSPLGTNQSGVVVFDNAIKWSQSDQQNWDLAIERANNMTPVKQPSSSSSSSSSSTSSSTSTTNNTTSVPSGDYRALAQQDAIKYGISPTYFVNQIQQESGFDPYAQSPAGAVGIAQFEPATAAAMGVNPYDPVSALDGAARFMASLSEEFNGNYAMALAAYNAGPGAVQDAEQSCGDGWLSCLPAETQSYVSIIMG